MNKRLISMEDIIPLIQVRLEEGGSVSFSPRGTSMLPMLREGIDTVTLSPLPERIKKYDLPLYRRQDGQYVLHRVVKSGETFACIGDNQFLVESDIKREQMIALVTSFTRGKREYKVNDSAYRWYCILWHYSRPFRRIFRSLKIRLKRFLKL